MNGNTGEFAVRFRQVNDAVIQCAQECSADDWRRMVPHEGRSVAYLIDHIAFGYQTETRAVRACVTGREQPAAPHDLRLDFTMAELDALNAERWAANPYPDREETIERLRTEGDNTATVLASLSDAELQRTLKYGPLPEMTVAQFVERLVIGHPMKHLPGIRQELDGSPPQ